MIKSLSAGVPKERAMEKAFKAGAYWWQIGEHFGMSEQTAYETVKCAKKKCARGSECDALPVILSPHPEGVAHRCVSRDGAATDPASRDGTLFY